ncbi:hypothetical protein VM1G_08021 [Cytospora mali]|uniref:Uncharacterized protein n=1 Tax=Cytospora mali TaxID=578113 RepID=A0A194W6X1_CYTMA|nr:hypothetical protein VM1G_08021 [Valsa mali]
MVGRVSRKNSSTQPPETHHPGPVPSASSGVTWHSDGSQVTPGGSNESPGFNNEMLGSPLAMDTSAMDWTAEFHYHGISDALASFDPSIVPFDPSPTPSGSGSGKSSGSLSECGPKDAKYSPLGHFQMEVGMGLDPPNLMLPPAVGDQDGPSSLRPTMDKRCIFAATQIINTLESWIPPSTSQSPEVLLDVAGKAGLGLNNLIGLQPKGESHRCLALFAVISDQISDILGASLARLEVMKITPSMPMTRGSGSGSGSSTQHNATLERLDGINALISSYHPAAAKTEDGHNQHHIALLQRLSDEVESNLVIVWKVTNLGNRSREMPWDLEGDGTQQTMDSGVFFEAIKARLQGLRQHLYNVVSPA